MEMTARDWYHEGFLRGACFVAGLVMLALLIDVMTRRAPVVARVNPVELDPERDAERPADPPPKTGDE